MARPLVAHSPGSPQSPILFPNVTSTAIIVEKSYHITAAEKAAAYRQLIDMVRSRVPPNVEEQGPEDALHPFAYLKEFTCVCSRNPHSTALLGLMNLSNDKVEVIIRLKR